MVSPFTPSQSYNPIISLQTVTNNAGLPQNFEYDASGEMTRVVLPYGGALRWAYRNFTFGANNTTVSEIQNRYLTKAIGATEVTYALVHNDSADASAITHGYTCLNDPSGIGQKCWFFDNNAANWTVGLNTSYEDRATVSGTVMQSQVFTWAGSGTPSPNVSSVLRTIDPGTAYQKQSKLEASVNSWSGSVSQLKAYEFGNLTTPARTYWNSCYQMYVSPSSTKDLLVSSALSDGSQTISLVNNSFDGGGLTEVSGLREHDATFDSTFSARGNLATSVSFGKTTIIGYDITGSPISVTDGLGHTVTTTPAPGTNDAAPGQITTNGLHTDTLTYSPWLGVTSDTGLNTANSTMVYDSLARPYSSTSPNGATTTYDRSISPPTHTETTNGKWVKTTMDGLGRAIKVEAGYGTTVVSVTESEYDSLAGSPVGVLKRTSLPHAPGGTVYWTTYTYDGLGRTVSVLAADGVSAATNVYQGNTTKTIDPTGKWKTYVTNAAGNLTQVIEPDPQGGADLTTNYTYDLLNHLTQVSMPRGAITQTRTFVYDAATQQLSSATNPETGTVNFTYNADGTLATKVDAKGQKVQFTYDAKQRQTAVQRYPNGSTEDVCQGLLLATTRLPLGLPMATGG